MIGRIIVRTYWDSDNPNFQENWMDPKSGSLKYGVSIDTLLIVNKEGNVCYKDYLWIEIEKVLESKPKENQISQVDFKILKNH